MQVAAQELLKEYVKTQQFSSTTEIMQAIKEIFRDVIQTAMEVELDEELGQECCECSKQAEGMVPDYQNGRELKRSLERWKAVFPAIETGVLNRRLSANTSGTQTAWMRRFYLCTPVG